MKKIHERITPIALGLVAVFFVVAGWTPHTSWQPDSYCYAGAAENLAKGLGLSITDKTTGDLHPLIHFPPLTSACAAFLIYLFGISASSALMIISAVSLGLISMLVFHQMCRAGQRSRIGFCFAIACTLSMIFSKHLLQAFQTQQSEPLFILLLVIGCTLSHDYLETGRPRLLVLIALVSSLAFLTRYVGVFLVVATAVLFIMNSRKSLVMRLRDILEYGAIFSIFFFGLFLRNFLVSEQFSSHTMTEGAGSRAIVGIYESTLFVVPGSLPGWIRIPAFLTFVVFALVLLVCLPKPTASGKRPLQTVYVATAVVYLLFQLAMCFNVTTQLNTRTLLPFYVPLFVGFSIAVCDRLDIPFKKKSLIFLRTCAIVFMTGFAALSFVRAIEHIHQNRTATIPGPGNRSGTEEP